MSVSLIGVKSAAPTVQPLGISILGAVSRISSAGAASRASSSLPRPRSLPPQRRVAAAVAGSLIRSSASAISGINHPQSLPIGAAQAAVLAPIHRDAPSRGTRRSPHAVAPRRYQRLSASRNGRLAPRLRDRGPSHSELGAGVRRQGPRPGLAIDRPGTHRRRCRRPSPRPTSFGLCSPHSTSRSWFARSGFGRVQEAARWPSQTC